MKSIKVKILGPVAVLAVLVLVTSAFSILGAGNIEKKGRVISDEYLADRKSTRLNSSHRT